MSEERTWQAFQYVSGELTADEERAFEERLADDQSLRDLVADLVTTCEAVRVVESERVAQPHTVVAATTERPRRSGLVVVTCLAIAALVVVVAVSQRPDTGDRSGNRLANDVDTVDPTLDVIDPVAEEDVLALWAESTVGADEQDALPNLDGLLDPNSGLAEGDEEFVVPGWMFAALEPERMEEMMEEAGEPLPESTRN